MSAKTKFLITDKIKNKMIGVFISLFAIYLSLNLANVGQYDFVIYIARAITWFISFFVGSVFTYIIYLLILIFGLFLIFKKDEFHLRISWTYILGMILFSLGGMIIISNAMCALDGEILTFANFGVILKSNVIETGKNFVIKFESNAGILGMLLVASFNSFLSSAGTYVIGSLIFIAGIVFLLFIPGKKLYSLINDYRNFNVNFDPNGRYTKMKDITLTTTTINSLEDEENLDIETKKEENKDVRPLTKDHYFNDLKEQEEVYNSNNPPVSSQFYNGEHFEDKPLTKPKFEYDPKKEPEIFVDSKNIKEERSEKKIEEKNSVNFETTPTYPLYEEKPVITSHKENKVSLKPKKKIRYVTPSINLLETRITTDQEQKNAEIADDRMFKINEVLNDLGIKARVVSYKIGPSVTRFDVKTEKSESIKGFETYLNDICIRLGGIVARFSPIVLGKTSSGLEIANLKSTMVNFKDCMQALNRLNKTKPTSIIFGKDINNELLIADLQDMPHLLVSGTTGSGKSIFVHSLIMNLLMRNSPNDLKFVLIDPKTVELNKYREIPHLMCPPISMDDPEKPYEVLKKICDMMEERYRLFAETDCSKLKEYNEYALKNNKETLPVIIVVIDEYADLIEVNKKMSEPVVRLAQKARAAGIHMIVATQRPSVNVINGVIKANIPSRIALLSTSYTDSSTILDQGGAEKLIGNGDMLIKCPILSNASVIRCQGAFVSNDEIRAVCDFLRTNYGPDYDEEIMEIINRPIAEDPSLVLQTKESRFGNDEDLYFEIKKYVMSEDFISTNKIQNIFGIGFNRASRFFKRLQAEGVISDDPATNSAKGSRVLIHNFDTTIKKSEFNGTVEQTTFKKN